MPCPLCKHDFEIPKDGVAGLTARTHVSESERLARQFDDKIKQITSRFESICGVASRVEAENSKLLSSTQATEREIKNKGEEVKQSFARRIDRQVSDLLDKLQSMKSAAEK